MKCDLLKGVHKSLGAFSVVLLVAGFCFVTTQAAQGDLLTGLELYSSMDTINTTTGVVPDDSANGYNGQLAGTATRVTDPERGEVLDITGTSGGTDYVTYGDVLDPGSTSYTVSFWFKFDDDVTRNLVSKGMSYSSSDGGWSIGYSEGADAIFFRANYGVDTHRLNIMKVIPSEELNDFLGSWHHMAAVINQEGGYIAGYLDGVGSGTDGSANGWQIVSTSYYATFTPGVSFETDTTRAAPINELTIGGTKSSGNPLNGRVDDLAIWSRALSNAEIQSLVPEPSSLVLIMLGLCSLLSARGKSSR